MRGSDRRLENKNKTKNNKNIRVFLSMPSLLQNIFNESSSVCDGFNSQQNSYFFLQLADPSCLKILSWVRISNSDTCKSPSMKSLELYELQSVSLRVLILHMCMTKQRPLGYIQRWDYNNCSWNILSEYLLYIYQDCRFLQIR